MFMEFRDENGNVVDRLDEDGWEVTVSTDPRGGVLLHNLGSCDIWLDHTSKKVPEQGCVSDLTYVLDDGTEVEMIAHQSGSWTFASDRLSVSLNESYKIETKEVREVFHVEAIFDGAPSAIRGTVPVGDDTDDDPPTNNTIDEDDNDPVIIVSSDDEDGGDPVTPSGNQCSSNADCSYAEECKSGSCEPHMYCAFGYGEDDDYDISVSWSGCDDGKQYEGVCGRGYASDAWQCDCIINGVEVAAFSTERGLDFTAANLHREFNSACGWLLPQMDEFY